MHLNNETTAAVAAASRTGHAEAQAALVFAGVQDLAAVQELADARARREGHGLMSFPALPLPTLAAGQDFLRSEAADAPSVSTAEWLRLQWRAHARDSDVVLPTLLVLAADMMFALLPVFTAAFLLPGLLLTYGLASRLAALSADGGTGGARHGPDRSFVTGVAALLASGVSVFVSCVLPVVRVTQPYWCIFETVSFLVCVSAFAATILVEPGIVPLGGAASHEQAVATGVEATRYCGTCNVKRPVRSKHCSTMNRCIRRYDHYCPLVLNAVGEQNQGPFVLFCLSMLATQVSFLRLTVAVLSAGPPLREALNTTQLPLVLLNAAAVLAALVLNCFLCWRALYGMLAELTVNEMENAHRYLYLRSPDGAFENPFDAGFVANIAAFWAPTFGRGSTDWDARLAAHRASPRPPPLLSAASARRIFRLLCCKLRANRHSGHSHGGIACKGHDRHSGADVENGGTSPLLHVLSLTQMGGSPPPKQQPKR